VLAHGISARLIERETMMTEATDIIRVELGLEVEPGRWRYSVPAYGVDGCSHQPLLDACRQVKSLCPETAHQQIGLYRRSKDKPDLSCTVEVGAATTVSENKDHGPVFVKFQPFDPDAQSRLEGGLVPQKPRAKIIDVSVHRDTANRPSGEASDDYPGVIAVIDGGRSRVIVSSDGIQWIVQHREGIRWRSRSHCRTKEALLRCCGYDPHPNSTRCPTASATP
jgi:hypothetical protein